jgi:hypothetical protein
VGHLECYTNDAVMIRNVNVRDLTSPVYGHSYCILCFVK